MNLQIGLVTAQTLNDNAWQLVIAFIMFAVGVGLVSFGEKLVLKAIGIFAALGGLTWLLAMFDLSRAVQLTAAAGVLLLVSIGQAGSSKGGTRLVFIGVGVVSLLALIALFPGVVQVPTGTIWDVLVTGWNTFADILNIGADAAVPP